MAVAAVASVAVAATDDVHAAALAVASLAAGHQLVSVFEDLQCSTRFIYDTIGRGCGCERGCGAKGNGAETHTQTRTQRQRPARVACGVFPYGSINLHKTKRDAKRRSS